MNYFQKTVKYCAMVFAGLLAVAIIGGILSAIVEGVGGVIPGKINKDLVTISSESDVETSSDITDGIEYTGVKELKLDIGIYKVVIETKDSIQGIMISSSGSDDNLNVEQSGDSLKVETTEKDWLSRWFSGNKSEVKGTVYVTVSSNMNLEKLEIDSGVGSVKINGITAEELSLDCGVGSISCEDIEAEKADIEGGVGSINLQNVILNGLDLEGGVGSVNVQGQLTGKTSIEGGMGSVSIEINGNRDDYNIKSETGIGSIYVDNDKVGNVNYQSNNTNNTLELEGGMGSIHVNFS